MTAPNALIHKIKATGYIYTAISEIPDGTSLLKMMLVKEYSNYTVQPIFCSPGSRICSPKW